MKAPMIAFYDSQGLGCSVKLSTWKAFYHTKAAV